MVVGWGVVVVSGIPIRDRAAGPWRPAKASTRRCYSPVALRGGRAEEMCVVDVTHVTAEMSALCERGAALRVVGTCDGRYDTVGSAAVSLGRHRLCRTFQMFRSGSEAQ